MRRGWWMLVCLAVAGPREATAAVACSTPSRTAAPSGALQGQLLLESQLRGGATDAAALRPRESYHVSRKAFHFLTIYSLASLYSSSGEKGTTRFARGLAALDTAIIVGELVRLQSPRFNRVVIQAMGPFMRKHEVHKFSGVMYCLCGLGVAALLVPKNAALLGMLQLAIGDPVAALVGHASRPYKCLRLKNGKSIAGTLACTLVLTAVNTAVLSNATYSGTTGVPNLHTVATAAAALALLAALVELLIPTPQLTLRSKAVPLALDDNFVVPVLSAVAAHYVLRAASLTHCVLARLLFR